MGFLLFLLLPVTLFSQCPPTISIVPLSGSTQVTGNSVAMCSGDSVRLNANPALGVTHQWYNELGAIAGEDTSFMFAKQPGFYYVMVSGCAVPSQQISITLKPKPVITLTPSVSPPHICSSDTIDITVTTIPASVQWTWFQPAAAFGTSLNPLSLILFTNTNYLVVGVNNDPGNGCSNTASMQVLVDYPIDGGLIGYNDTICAGEIPDSIVSLAPPSGGSGSYTYVWSYSTVSSVGPWTLIPGETGMGYQPGPLYDTTWFSRAASSPPCSSGWTPPIEVIVHSYPSVTNAGTDSLCTGNTLNFTPLSNVPGTTFTWTASVTSPGVNVTGWSATGTGAISNQLFLDPGTSVPGEVTYVITPIGPEPTLCAGVPSNLVVTVNPIPTVTNSPMSQEICSGGTTTLVVLQSAVAGTHFNWYATTQPGISGYQPTGNDSIPVQTILSTRTDSGYVYYHITPYGPDPTNCPGPEVVYSILVKPSPTVTNFPMYQYICSGDTSQEVVLTSNVAGTTFVWTSSASAGVTGNTPSGTNVIPPEPLLNPGTTQGVVTYHITPSGNLFACPATPRDYIIYVDPIPSITSSLVESVCSNAPFSYTITSNVNGSTFTWERLSNPGILNPGTTGIGFTINETLINITGSPVVVTYILTPTGPVPSTCPGIPDTLYLTVNPLPTVDAGSDQTINCGTSTQLSGTASGGVGTLTYTWNPPALIQSGLNTLTPVTVNLTSSVIFSLIVTDLATGCQKSDVVQVNITGACLSISPTATPPTICVGQISHLNANPLGGSGTYTWFWSAPGFTSSNATPDVSPLVTTTYHVIVDDGYSSVNGNVTVTVNPLPALYNVTGGGEFCSGMAGVPVGLSGSQLQTNYVLQRTGWQSPPVPGTGGAITFGNINSGGLYTVIATNTVTGCQQQMNGSATVIVNPLPQVNAGADQVIPYGTSTVLSGVALGGTGTLSYEWTPIIAIFSGQGTLTPHTTNLYVNTEYTLEVTDQKTCVGTDQVWVYLSGDPLSVTSAATPLVICNNGQDVYLSAVAAGGSGSYAYSWSSVPAGPIPPGQNPVVNPTVTTSYIVTASDGYNLARDTVVVTVNPLPVHYSVTGGGSYCSGFHLSCLCR